MKFLIILTLLLAPNSGLADSTPKTGLWITPDASSFQPRQTGQSHQISGDICRVWINSASSTPNCLKIKNQNLEVHAFYPDATQEITSQLTLDKQDRKIHFNYNIASVSGSPSFTLLVGFLQGETLGLMKSKAKLERHLQLLLIRIAELHSQGGHASLLVRLNKLKNNLLSVIAKIDGKLSKRPEIIAKVELPLQIDNQRAPASRYFSHLGGFKFDFLFNPGQSIQGNRSQVSAKITKIDNGPGMLNDQDLDEDEDGDHDTDEEPSKYHWSADLYWQGIKIKAFAPQALNDGESLSHDFLTEALSPQASNIIQFELYRNKKKNNGGYHQKVRWGKLRQFHPVSPDTIAPTWLAGSSIENQAIYAQNMNAVMAVVKDQFGSIDPAGFEAKLNQQNIASQLQFISIDQGQSYQVSGDLNPLIEGDYTISLKAKDLTGQFALPNPLTKSFHIDRTKPLLSLNLLDATILSHSPIDLGVTVLDASPVQTVVKLNDQIVTSDASLAFNVGLNLQEGLNSVEVYSTDAAGNLADVAKINLFLDTTPPMLSQIVPANNSVLTSRKFLYHLQCA